MPLVKKTRKKTSTVDRDLLRRLWEEGVQPAQIAEKIGRSKCVMYAHAREMGLTRPLKESSVSNVGGVKTIKSKNGCSLLFLKCLEKNLMRKLQFNNNNALCVVFI